MSTRGKIAILAALVVLISCIFAFTYISFAKEQEKEEVVAENVVEEEQKQEVKVAPEAITFVNMIDEDTNTVNEVEPEEEEEEENKVIKEITYKGKTVEVPKAEVAPANSAEDSQTKKTGGESTSAEEAVNKFENDGQSVGIDVSAHQGKIDWAQVKASGIEFAMIRVGFRGYTEGGIYEDAYFKSNINGAVNNGIMVGVYFYSVAKNEEEALQEAAWLIERIKSYRITYPVVYDFEDFTRGRTAGISGAQATANARTFLNYVASQGYTPMMYASKNDITTRFDKGSLGYKFWLAHYTSATNYTGSYQMWQYTSSGSVPGIAGRVDMNVAYFRYGSVAEPKHTHDFANGTIIKTPDSKAPTCTETGVQYRRCKDCSESQKEDIPPTGVHNFGEYVVTKEPTEKAQGEKTRECTMCHKKEVQKIDKLKPKPKPKPPVENTTNTQKPSTNTTTSNNTNTTNNTNTNTNINTDTNTNTTVTPTPEPPKEEEPVNETPKDPVVETPEQPPVENEIREENAIEAQNVEN